jgi:hypothetical protein
MMTLPSCLAHLHDIPVESLTPSRRAAFDKLVAAGHASEAAEENVKITTKRLIDAVAFAAQCRAAIPKVSFMDIWRAAKDA